MNSKKCEEAMVRIYQKIQNFNLEKLGELEEKAEYIPQGCWTSKEYINQLEATLKYVNKTMVRVLEAKASIISVDFELIERDLLSTENELNILQQSMDKDIVKYQNALLN